MSEPSMVFRGVVQEVGTAPDGSRMSAFIEIDGEQIPSEFVIGDEASLRWLAARLYQRVTITIVAEGL